MINLIDNNKFGVNHYAMTDLNDLEILIKKGLATGSTATLYTQDGNMRIWVFLIEEDLSKDGKWIELI